MAKSIPPASAGVNPREARRPHLVSVVVSVRNEESNLAEQLEALAGQTYGGDWELLVVDNGSRDRSIEIAQGFASRLPLRIVEAAGPRSLNHARNVGAAEARGDYLAFCDGDDVVSPGWLEALVGAAGEADIVGGRLDFVRLNESLHRAWRPNEPQRALFSPYGFLPSAAGGNCGIWTEVAQEIGWDESYSGAAATDIEFSWRAQIASRRIAYAPDAVLHQRYRTTLRALAGQYYRYGKAGPKLYREFRAHGMPPADPSEARERWRWILRRSSSLIRGPERRGKWIRVTSFSLGRLVGSVRWRVRFL